VKAARIRTLKQEKIYYTFLGIQEKEYLPLKYLKKYQKNIGQNEFLCRSFDSLKVLNTPWGSSVLLLIIQ
jgi:hypothetical protein